MSSLVYILLCTVCVLMVLLGIYLMSKVKTATIGNGISALAVAVGIIVTLVYNKALPNYVIWVAMALGLAIGLLITKVIKMIEMPELVAVFNGVGGLASAIIAGFAYISSNGSVFAEFTSLLAFAIGLVTFVGSFVAGGKLHKLLPSKPIIIKHHSIITNISLFIVAVIILLGTAVNMPMWLVLVLLGTISIMFGLLFSIRVGGADMPITISLLNSLSGVAGAVAGMAIGDILLVAVGGVVGASGLLLTQIMCKAMNRKLLDILIPKKRLAKKAVSGTESTSDSKMNTVHLSLEKTMKKDINVTPESILHTAKDVIIVPGYGMALSQAQHAVKALTDKLESNGATVRFAIHPVAGRMPGHMNVLLCEADIPYEKLYEMDDINPSFATADLTIVIGANDVVNPSANTQEDTPIYGMPILNVNDCKTIFICNFDTKFGYAGVDNPIYERKDGVYLLLGDAKATLQNLT